MVTVAHSPVLRLRALETEVFAAAKRWLFRAMAFGLAAVFVAGIGVLLPESTLVFLVPLSAALTLAAYFAFRLQEERYWTGVEILHRERLADGLGVHVDGMAMQRLRDEAGDAVSIRPDTGDFRDDFYEAAEPAGGRRLLHIVDESAFWTSRLYRIIHRYLSIGFGVAFSIFIISLVVSTVIIEALETRQTMFKLVLALIPAMVSFELFCWVVRLPRIARRIETVHTEAHDLRTRPHVPDVDAMRLLGEYQSWLMIGLPVSDRIYERHHHAIQMAWNEVVADDRRSTL